MGNGLYAVCPSTVTPRHTKITATKLLTSVEQDLLLAEMSITED